jgi:hypothetical protein
MIRISDYPIIGSSGYPLHRFFVFALFTRLPRFDRDGFAGFLIDAFHRQLDLAALVKADDHDFHVLTFADNVRRLGNAAVGEFGNVNKPVASAHEVHECAEIHDLNDFAVIDLVQFRFFGDAFDDLDRGINRGTVNSGDFDRPVVIDVDFRSGFLNDARGSPCRPGRSRSRILSVGMVRVTAMRGANWLISPRDCDSRALPPFRRGCASAP